jgi:hypothetical protein
MRLETFKEKIGATLSSKLEIFRDSAGRIRLYMRADDGKIQSLSEEYLKGNSVLLALEEFSSPADDANGATGAKAEQADILLPFLKDLAGAGLVLLIPLYVGGWTYLRVYYKRFGLSLTELGFSLYDALIYSIPVLIYKWWVTVILFFLLLATGLAFSSKQVSRIPWPLRTMSFVILFFILVVGISNWGAHVGKENAIRDINQDTTTLPYVGIEIDPEKVKYNRAEYAEYDRSDCVLLLCKNEQYYIFRPLKHLDDQIPKVPNRSIEVFAIPANLVNRVRMEIGVEGTQ